MTRPPLSPSQSLAAIATFIAILACSRSASAEFNHGQRRVGFPLTGKHLEVACQGCHTKKDVFRDAPRSCEGCHKPSVAHGDFGPCADCHVTSGFTPARFSHARSNLPLDGKHKTVACQKCHSRFRSGMFLAGPNGCILCHDNPHDDQFSAFSGGSDSGCMDCHDASAFKPTTMTPAKHAAAGMPLLGAHAKVACARCHQNGQLAATPKDCGACHVDRHEGRFGADCRRCHEESAWTIHPGFDHKKETDYPLEGAHLKVACAACHETARTKASTKSGARSELAAVKKPRDCVTCHPTNGPRGHGGQFGADCTRCHKVTRFTDVPPFDHNKTMFPLERRHMAVPCTDCHSAVRARPVPDCRTCHDDPHRGRTLLDCGECHRADSWNLVRFDHDRTEFRLNGAHFVVPCRSCHVSDIWVGLQHECIFCHRGERVRANGERPTHRMNSFDCAACHNAFRW